MGEREGVWTEVPLAVVEPPYRGGATLDGRERVVDYKEEVLFLLKQILLAMHRMRPRKRRVKRQGVFRWEAEDQPIDSREAQQRVYDKEQKRLREELEAERLARESKGGVIVESEAKQRLRQLAARSNEMLRQKKGAV